MTTPTTVAATPDLEQLTEAVAPSPHAIERVAQYQLATIEKQLQMQRQAATMLANQTWGANMSLELRGALSRWALENGVDPVTEIDVLGGNTYLNAKFYLRRLGEHPDFRGYEVELLAPLDGREILAADVGEEMATQLRESQKKLNARRLALQMKWGVPEEVNKHRKTSAAALVRLLWAVGEPTIGVNWAGSYGRTSRNGKGVDPIGDAHPVKTAITRAFRKAALTRVGTKRDMDRDGVLSKLAELITQERHTIDETLRAEGDFGLKGKYGQTLLGEGLEIAPGVTAVSEVGPAVSSERALDPYDPSKGEGVAEPTRLEQGAEPAEDPYAEEKKIRQEDLELSGRE